MLAGPGGIIPVLVADDTKCIWYALDLDRALVAPARPAEDTTDLMSRIYLDTRSRPGTSTYFPTLPIEVTGGWRDGTVLADWWRQHVEGRLGLQRGASTDMLERVVNALHASWPEPSGQD